jgi:UDP-GlcNAc:undecaprenyl-phosphate/decaprenyl-phosphate GlcNAc-1-phosphate transferase
MNITLLLTSLVLASLSLFIFNKQFLKRKLIDKITSRSSHKTIATRSGGMSIFIILFIISTFFYISGEKIFDYSIFIPLGILLLVGFYDDLYDVDFKLKFIFQIIAAKIIIDSGLVIDNLHGVLGINELNRIFSQIFSIFIIVAIINSINFIDGIDGLAISVTALFILLFESLSISTTPFFNLSLILIMSIIPMLFFNLRKKNKVFLGDSGSLFFGGLVSIYIMFILSSEYQIIEKYDINKIFYVLSVLTYPIFDITRVVIIRIINGNSPFKADKNHIHHMLVNKFSNHYQVVILILLLSLIIFSIIHLLL